MTKPGRNDPCPCGSGKKYKKCCAQKALGTRQVAVGPSNFSKGMGGFAALKPGSAKSLKGRVSASVEGAKPPLESPITPEQSPPAQDAPEANAPAEKEKTEETPKESD